MNATKAPEFPWFPMFAADWLTSQSVRLMPFAAQGMYIALLCYQWGGGSIPADPARIARLIGADAQEFQAAWEYLEIHFPVEDGVRRNPRLVTERAAQEEKRDKRASAGRDAAQARWKKGGGQGEEGDADAMRTQCQSDPESDPDSSSPSEPKKSAKAKTPEYDPVETMMQALPESHRTEDVRAAWVEYVAFRVQANLKRPVPQSLKSQAAHFAKYPPGDVAAAIRHSVAQGYAGIFPERIRERGRGSGGPPASVMDRAAQIAGGAA